MLQVADKKVNVMQAENTSFQEWHNKWTAIGLSTEPVNRQLAEFAMKKAYAMVALEAPQRIIWSKSPFAQDLARAIILSPAFLEAVRQSVWRNILTPTEKIKDDVRDSIITSVRLIDSGLVKKTLKENIQAEVREAITEQQLELMTHHARSTATTVIWDGVWASVWEGVWDLLWKSIDSGIKAALRAASRDEGKNALNKTVLNSLRDAIGPCVKANVWEMPMERAWSDVRQSLNSKTRVTIFDNLWGSLRTSIWDNVVIPIGESVKACGNDSTIASAYGQHDAYWLSFYDYIQEVEKMTNETKSIAGLMEVAKLSSWFSPHRYVCWMCERPTAVSLNERGRLHCETGPALSYGDGWSIYSNDGMWRF